VDYAQLLILRHPESWAREARLVVVDVSQFDRDRGRVIEGHGLGVMGVNGQVEFSLSVSFPINGGCERDEARGWVDSKAAI